MGRFTNSLSLYTLWAMLLLAVMLVGSPLAGFGCHTVVPAHFSAPCNTNLAQTAVQTNAAQPAAPLCLLLVAVLVCCRPFTDEQYPQEIYLLPPSPPPRLLV